jgi:hypothetical protein
LGKAAIRSLNGSLKDPKLLKDYERIYNTKGSGNLFDALAKKTGKEIYKPQIGQLKENMVLGVDADKKAGYGKHGIDHVVMTMRDKKTGKLQIVEAAGGKVRRVIASDGNKWLSRQYSQGRGVWATDAFGSEITGAQVGGGAYVQNPKTTPTKTPPPVVAKGPEVVDLKEKARLEQLKVQQATVAELGKVTSGDQQLTTVTKETKESKEVRSEEGSVNKNLAGIPRDIMTYMFGLEPDGTTSTGLI